MVMQNSKVSAIDGINGRDSHFEEENGLVVADAGQVVCHGRLRTRLAAHSPELAKGFHVDELESAYVDLLELRRKLGG